VSDAGELTDRVAASFDASDDPRFRELMQALVRHLHAYAREIGLSEDEWFTAIDFLTRAGQISSDRRQELVLLSDVLGLSMLTVGMNQGAGTDATEPTVFGPFFVEDAPRIEEGGDLAQGAKGDPCFVRGRVVDTSGEPVAGARVDVWEADGDGLYDVQRPELEGPQGRGHLVSGLDGRFSFRAVKPVAYPIPDDGPAGELLAAAGRGPMRPAHMHFMITADGYRRLITHVFDASDEHLDRDAVFGVKQSLMAEFERDESGRYALDFEFVIQPDST
jgi:hydroxyquinol 1,2-dioxygenase